MGVATVLGLGMALAPPASAAAAGDIALASTSDAGVKGNANSSIVSLSADGGTVAIRNDDR
ncbi:MAG: hypothetical protein M3Q84_00600 [Actinomycetota bacterium]|nr:hypothetical protein [Actinomycetota bacterium]